MTARFSNQMTFIRSEKKYSDYTTPHNVPTISVTLIRNTQLQLPLSTYLSISPLFRDESGRKVRLTMEVQDAMTLKNSQNA